MKIILSVSFSLLLTASVQAQKKPASSGKTATSSNSKIAVPIGAPKGSTALTTTPVSNPTTSGTVASEYDNLRRTYADSAETIAKFLADLAVEDIGSGVEEANVEAAKYNYLATRTSWMDRLAVSGNLNEFTIKGQQNINPYGNSLVYPRYNIGVSIPLGIFVNQPKLTKVQYYNYQAELESLRRQKENYKLQVVTAYYNFISRVQLLAIQEEALRDAEFAHKNTEDRFEKGEIPLDVYTATSRKFNSEQASKTSLETEMRITKAQLEALLGMPLETAMARRRR